MRKLYCFGVLVIAVTLLLVGCLGGGSGKYNVSGVVKNGMGVGIAGVELTLEGKGISIIVGPTTADGKWSAQGLKGKVKITPAKLGWSFNPASQEVTKENTKVDFVGAEGEYSAFGAVLDALGTGIAGVELALEGEGIAFAVLTGEDGKWSVGGLTGAVRVTPTKLGWFFNPESQEVTFAQNEADFSGAKGERLTVHIDGGGRVVQEVVVAAMGVDYYPRTTQVQLTAEPDLDWFFFGWEGDVPEGAEAENPIIIVLDDPKEITAVFKEKSTVNGYIGVAHSFPVALEQLGIADTGGTRVGSDLKTVEICRDRSAYRMDEQIIRFDPSMSRSEQQAVLLDAGYEILDTIEVLNAHLVRRTARALVKEATDLRGVLSTEYNWDVSLLALEYPNDPMYGRYQWWHYDQIRLPQAWAVTTGDASIRVAVIDTGIDRDHPELMANVDLASAVDFTDDGDIEDGHGHGTHVAGTIGAVTNNATGVAGIMWEVDILPIKVFDASGRGSGWNVVQGILYAAGLLNDQEDKPHNPKPADIVNMSLGGPFSELERDAVQAADARGVILVAATGNEERPVVSYPAAHPEVIAVGATGNGLDSEPPLAYYSNYGDFVDVVAPGGGVDPALGIMDFVVSTAPGGYMGMAGTSMATPHVSGVIGLMLSNGIPKSEVREILHRTSMEIHIPGFNPYFGHGLINAYWAVNAVEDMRVIQGLREGIDITAVAETTLPAKGGQLLLELVAGEYQLMAWIDVNGNDILDTGDYFTETPVLPFGYGEGWVWTDEVVEVVFIDDIELDSLATGVLSQVH